MILLLYSVVPGSPTGHPGSGRGAPGGVTLVGWDVFPISGSGEKQLCCFFTV